MHQSTVLFCLLAASVESGVGGGIGNAKYPVLPKTNLYLGRGSAPGMKISSQSPSKPLLANGNTLTNAEKFRILLPKGMTAKAYVQNALAFTVKAAAAGIISKDTFILLHKMIQDDYYINKIQTHMIENNGEIEPDFLFKLLDEFQNSQQHGAGIWVAIAAVPVTGIFFIGCCYAFIKRKRLEKKVDSKKETEMKLKVIYHNYVDEKFGGLKNANLNV